MGKIFIGIRLFLLIGIFNCCMDPMGRNVPDQISLSQKEIEFKDNLRKLGFSEIKYSLPDYGFIPKGRALYVLKLNCNCILKSSNIDSLIYLRKKIAKDLFTNVISNEAIMYSYAIDIVFDYKKKEIDPYKYDFLTDDISKDSLEMWCGFKVIEPDPGRYKRVKL